MTNSYNVSIREINLLKFVNFSIPSFDFFKKHVQLMKHIQICFSFISIIKSNVLCIHQNLLHLYSDYLDEYRKIDEQYFIVKISIEYFQSAEKYFYLFCTHTNPIAKLQC